MKLFIAEKPSLAQAIAAGIGVGKKFEGYISLNNGAEIVTWCYGHILEQLNPSEYDVKYQWWRMEDLPIVPSHWKLKVKSDAAKQLKIIRELIGKATTIVNAGDPDREGQLLVDEVLEYVGNKKPVQRILLNALDEKSIRQSLQNLINNQDFQGLKNAALGRSRADWLIGMNLSRAYTIQARQAGYESVPIGRVMTPTMALVVHRDEEISKFKPVTHYAVKVNFANKYGEIPTVWKMSEKVPNLDSEGRLLNSKYAEELVQKLNSVSAENFGKIIEVEEKNKQENQRLLYSLSTLQIEAGKLYGYSPQIVLDTMQMLYEKKLITYPRSDCEYLPENQLEDAPEILEHLKTLPNKEFAELVKGADLKIRSKAWNDKKITAHHAKDFAQKYTSSKGTVNLQNPFAHLQDIANTIINWLEYTQLVIRSDGKLSILPEKTEEVLKIISKSIPFILRPEEHEYFQRRYGIDIEHIKDTRNLLKTNVITDFMIAEMRVKKIFISLALKEPIGGINPELIEKISKQSGIKSTIVIEVLQKNFPHDAIGAFMANYFEMAFAGRDQCIEFEEATANIFCEIFKFHSTWLGSATRGRAVPDILLVSDQSGFQSIIDTEAYSRYDLPTIHRDRMIYHYLPEIQNYSSSNLPIGFFSYIAGGFSNTIATPLKEIVTASRVNGSAMPVTVFIKMAEKNSTSPYTHNEIKNIFSLNRQIYISDV